TPWVQLFSSVGGTPPPPEGTAGLRVSSTSGGFRRRRPGRTDRRSRQTGPGQQQTPAPCGGRVIINALCFRGWKTLCVLGQANDRGLRSGHLARRGGGPGGLLVESTAHGMQTLRRDRA